MFIDLAGLFVCCKNTSTNKSTASSLAISSLHNPGKQKGQDKVRKLSWLIFSSSSLDVRMETATGYWEPLEWDVSIEKRLIKVKIWIRQMWGTQGTQDEQRKVFRHPRIQSYTWEEHHENDTFMRKKSTWYLQHNGKKGFGDDYEEIVNW